MSYLKVMMQACMKSRKIQNVYVTVELAPLTSTDSTGAENRPVCNNYFPYVAFNVCVCKSLLKRRILKTVFAQVYISVESYFIKSSEVQMQSNN